eukprot:Hpha_TRINITY_DN15501_c4_g1::TRINITY_DN15501_c4_g1_i1::g.105533::m.105533
MAAAAYSARIGTGDVHEFELMDWDPSDPTRQRLQLTLDDDTRVDIPLRDVLQSGNRTYPAGPDQHFAVSFVSDDEEEEEEEYEEEDEEEEDEEEEEMGTPGRMGSVGYPGSIDQIVMSEDDPRLQLTGFFADEDVLNYFDGLMSVTWTLSDGSLRLACQGGAPNQVRRIMFDFNPASRRPLCVDQGYRGGVPPVEGIATRSRAMLKLRAMADRATPWVSHNLVAPGDNIRVRASEADAWRDAELKSLSQEGNLIVKFKDDPKPHSFDSSQVEASPPGTIPTPTDPSPAVPESVSPAIPKEEEHTSVVRSRPMFQKKTVTLERFDRKEGFSAPLQLVKGVPEAMALGQDGKASYERMWEQQFKADTRGNKVLYIMDEEGKVATLEYHRSRHGAVYFWRVETCPEDLWLVTPECMDSMGGPYIVTPADPQPFGAGFNWQHRMPSWRRQDGWTVQAMADGRWGVFRPSSARSGGLSLESMPVLLSETQHKGAMPQNDTLKWRTAAGEQAGGMKIIAVSEAEEGAPQEYIKSARKAQQQRRGHYCTYRVRSCGTEIVAEPVEGKRVAPSAQPPTRLKAHRLEALQGRGPHFTPYPVESAAAAVDGGRMIVFGGCQGADATQEENESYSLSTVTGEWRRVEGSKHVPYGRHGHTLTCVDNDEYLLIGGIGTGGGVDPEFAGERGNDLSELTELDLLPNRFWKKTLPHMQVPELFDHKGDLLGSRVHDGAKTFANIGRPSEVCELGLIRSRNGGVVSGRAVRATGFVRHLYTLDLRAGKSDWRLQLTDRKCYVAYHAAALCCGEVFVFGGVGKNYRCTNALKALTNPVRVPQAAQQPPSGLRPGSVSLRPARGAGFWRDVEPVGEVPPPRHGHTMVTNENELIVFGGHGGADEVPKLLPPDVYVFCAVRQRWEKLLCDGTAPMGRVGHAASVSSGVMYVVGGSLGAFPGSVAGFLSDEVWALNLPQQTWRAVKVAGVPRLRNHVCSVLPTVAGLDNPCLVLHGGYLQEIETWLMTEKASEGCVPSLQQWEAAGVCPPEDDIDTVLEAGPKVFGPVVRGRAGWFAPRHVKQQKEPVEPPAGVPGTMLKWKGPQGEGVQWHGPLRSLLRERTQTTKELATASSYVVSTRRWIVPEHVAGNEEGGKELGHAAAPPGSLQKEPRFMDATVDSEEQPVLLEHLVTNDTWVIPLVAPVKPKPKEEKPRDTYPEVTVKGVTRVYWDGLKEETKQKLRQLEGKGALYEYNKTQAIQRATREAVNRTHPRIFPTAQQTEGMSDVAEELKTHGEHIREDVPQALAGVSKSSFTALKEASESVWQAFNKLKEKCTNTYEKAKKAQDGLGQATPFPTADIDELLIAAENALHGYMRTCKENEPTGKAEWWTEYLKEGEYSVMKGEKRLGRLRRIIGTIVRKSASQAQVWVADKINKSMDNRLKVLAKAQKLENDEVKSAELASRRLREANEQAVQRERERRVAVASRRSLTLTQPGARMLRVTREEADFDSASPLEEWGWRIGDEDLIGPAPGAVGTRFHPAAVLRSVRSGSPAERGGGAEFSGLRITRVLSPGFDRPVLVTSKRGLLAALASAAEGGGVELFFGIHPVPAPAALPAALGVEFDEGSLRVRTVAQGGTADEAGVSAGMTVSSVRGRDEAEVQCIADLAQALSADKSSAIFFRSPPQPEGTLWVGWGWRHRSAPTIGRYELCSRTAPSIDAFEWAGPSRQRLRSEEGRWVCNGEREPRWGDLRSELHNSRLPNDPAMRWEAYDPGYGWVTDPSIKVAGGHRWAELYFESAPTGESGTVTVVRRRAGKRGYEDLGADWSKGIRLKAVHEGSAAARAGLTNYIGKRLSHVNGKQVKEGTDRGAQVTVKNALAQATIVHEGDDVAVCSEQHTGGRWLRGTAHTVTERLGESGPIVMWDILLEGQAKTVALSSEKAEVVPWTDDPPLRTHSVSLTFHTQKTIRIRKQRPASAHGRTSSRTRSSSVGATSASQNLSTLRASMATTVIAGHQRPNSRPAPKAEDNRSLQWARTVLSLWFVQSHCAALSAALPGTIAAGERVVIGRKPHLAEGTALSRGAPPKVRRDGEAEPEPQDRPVARDLSCSVHYTLKKVGRRGRAPHAGEVAEALAVSARARGALVAGEGLGLTCRPVDCLMGGQPSGGVLRFQSQEKADRAAAILDSMLLPGGVWRVRALGRAPYLPRHHPGREPPLPPGVGAAAPAAPPPPPSQLLQTMPLVHEEGGRQVRGAPEWVLPWSRGDRVRARRTIEFDRGQVVKRGTLGEVTRVPGTTPDTVAQVDINGVLFSARDSDIERDDSASLSSPSSSSSSPRRPSPPSRGALASLREAVNHYPASTSYFEKRDPFASAPTVSPPRHPPPTDLFSYPPPRAVYSQPPSHAPYAHPLPPPLPPPPPQPVGYWAEPSVVRGPSRAGLESPPREPWGGKRMARSSSVPALRTDPVRAVAQAAAPRRAPKMTPGEMQIAAARAALASRKPGQKSARRGAPPVGGAVDFYPRR